VENYGIYTNTIIGWIQDFLTGRYQRVAVNGENSNWEEVTSGIPYIYIGISTCPLIICSIHK
jgi:hypothetical protein